VPPIDLIVIFTLGTFVMRSAGCVINDIADRDLDSHVQRTRSRPLATGELGLLQALWRFVGLCFVALVLIVFLNATTRWFALGGLAIAMSYPFMKRWTYLPQVVLGAAFSWGIIMAFSAVSRLVPPEGWLLFVTSLMWIVAYDTMYAMVDRDDDLKIGVKSTAILFGQADRLMVGVLQISALLGFTMLGQQLEFGRSYQVGLFAIGGLFVYQQYLIRDRDREGCLRAFLNNSWVGFVLFACVLAEIYVTPILASLLEDAPS
jgi:4-hydroxybenzoate polyprenyltransferase